METTKQEFSIARAFNAPKELVFQAFSTAEALGEWWGPVEAPIDVIKLDFNVGGIFHYKMKGKHISYGVFRFKEIDEPNSITWINSFADENGEIIKPPFKDFDLTKEILNKITLDEKDGVTTLTLVSIPINASENEIATFNAITESMQQGYGGTLNQLDNYLKKIQTQ